ncbi:MAG: HDOD domain-containing protein, partial [Planctomycetota bacterium]
LRLCNSAYYGLAQKVTSIDEAAKLLGVATLLKLVLEAHTRTVLAPPQAGYGLQPGWLWRHSIAVAVGSQRLAERINMRDEGMLFTAGLLHDIGKIILNEHVGGAYAQIIALVREERLTFVEAESRVFGTTHAEVGALVAERWELPAPLVRCVRYHHEPSRLSEPDPRVDVVHLADAACLLMGIGGGDDGQFYRADQQALARTGLKQADFEALGVEIVTELKQIEDAFASES